MKQVVCLLALAMAAACAAGPQCEEHGQLLGNPLNCSTFFECSFGTPFLLACPPGLTFNVVELLCDYPGPNDLCPSRQTRPRVVCPPKGEDDDEAVQVPNPEDCASFYKCDEWGIPHLNPCPPGLHYNAELQVCDFPESAGCASSLLRH